MNEIALSVLIYLPEGLMNTPESSVTQQCSNRERKAEPVVLQSKASSPVQPATWGAGQLELRQQSALLVLELLLLLHPGRESNPYP